MTQEHVLLAMLALAIAIVGGLMVAILGMIRESLRGINDALWEIYFATRDGR